MIRVCRRYGAVFSLVLTRNSAVQRAIDAISEGRLDTRSISRRSRAIPNTGAWISDAEVAETIYTMAESGTGGIKARLIVRRVKDANRPADGLFPIWRYHPFFHQLHRACHRRRHRPPPPAPIIETTFADLIDGPLAHIPSGRFSTISAWAICAGHGP